MRGLTLGLTALLIAVPLAPAQALDRDGSHSRHRDRAGNVIASAPVGCDFRGGGGGGRHHRGNDGFRGGRSHRGSVDCVVGASWGYYGGEWALYNNRSWESDSYNDWWHDRPDRAFPRWVQNNQNCERIWSSGAGWRC